MELGKKPTDDSDSWGRKGGAKTTPKKVSFAQRRP
jgi:hypothetical protein